MASSKSSLKNGRKVEIEIVRSPSPSIYARIRELLHHKPSVYASHIDDFYRNGSDGLLEGLEWRFHLARCDGEYVGNVCTWEYGGIGILGHVFTKPEWRGLGVADALIRFQDGDFRGRGGHIMELNTGYDSMPYRIYLKRGYTGVPGAPGSMTKCSDQGAWANLCRAGGVRPSRFAWRHWPSANLLFLSENLSYVRAAGLGAYGPSSLEGAVIHNRERIWSDAGGLGGKVEVLETAEGTVVAWASLLGDLNWGRREPRPVFDLFFHPSYLERTGLLMEQFEIPSGAISYSTPGDPKNTVLERLDFRKKGEIPQFLSSGQTLRVYERI